MFKVLDLFSGIGGFSLGLERTGGFKTVAFCEIDPFCQKMLRKHWPDVPIYEDVRTLDHDGPIDVITAGYPCQPFSTASRGRKTAKSMWEETEAAIMQYDARFIIIENVNEQAQKLAKHRLECLGFRAFVKRIGTVDCGGNDQRNRWWVCAHSDNQSKLHGAVNAEVAKLPKICDGLWGAENYTRAIRVSPRLPNRVDRFRALGNSVNSYIPEAIGHAIMRVAAE